MVGTRQRPKPDTQLDTEDEEYPDDERWTRLTCPNGHTKKVEDLTEKLLWYCPDCGERRSVEANYIEPTNTKTDKI